MTTRAPERELLGCLLLDSDRITVVAALVRAEDFEERQHRAIFKAIVAVHVRGAPVTFVTVLEELKVCGEDGAQCTASLLVELGQTVTSSAHATHFARMVAECADLRRVVRRLANWQQEHEAIAVGDGRAYDAIDRLADDLRGLKRQGVPLGAVETVCLADVESKPIRWLWPGRIPAGKLTLLAGDPGLGKSVLTLDIAARVSRGASWPDVDGISSPGRVLICTAEDALDDTVRPRLEAAGAQLDRVRAIQGVRVRDGERALNLADDLRALEREIAAFDGVRLLIVDPVTAFLGDTDAHKNADVRRVLAPLAALAERTGVAVLAVTHLNKSQSGSGIYRANGSIGFVALARAAWFVAKDRQDPTRRLMLQGKNNLGDASGLAFRVDSASGPQGTSVPVIAWESDPVTVSLDDALAPPEGGSASELDRACEFLRSELADGAVSAQQVQQGARAHGIAEKTLNRAKKELGVRVDKRSFSGGWRWSLPEDGKASDSPGMATLEEHGHLRPDSGRNGTVLAPGRFEVLEDGQHNGMASFGDEVAP